jgi:hypothetical protein
MEMEEMKNCSVCKQEKPFAEFNKSAKTVDGYTYRCKPCQSVYYKGYNASRKAAKQQVEVQSKVCRECGLEKPMSQFGIKATSLDKHNIYCKPCWRIRCYESMKRNAR